jgi:sortase A
MNVGKSLGVLLIVAGLALGGLVAWTVADPLAGHRQHALQQQLQRTWATQKPVPGVSQPVPAVSACTDPAQRLKPSQPFALMTIPAFGPRWKFAVVEGTTLTQLALGPGHITGTSMPGGVNFGVAAHDITAGNPFLHLWNLKPGNQVIVTTAHCQYTYAVDSHAKVSYTDVAVLKSRTAYPHTLILVTCWPVTLAFTPVRIVVWGHEVSVRAR